MKDFLKQVIREAGFLAKGYYEEGVEHSYKTSLSDFVTVADKKVSQFLINKIQEKYPDHGIISEEEPEEINPGAEYTWVMDPIDGTRNFAKHIAVWCTMVGVTKNGRPLMSAVYDAMNDELFFAEVGKGAYCNERKIKVSQTEEVEHSFLIHSTGVNDGSIYDSGRYHDFKRFLDNLMGDTGHWIHQYGTILSACHLADGRIDAFVNNAGLYHDYLAPYIIATEAGAVWTTCDGKPWTREEKNVVVANPKLHPKLLKLFK